MATIQQRLEAKGLIKRTAKFTIPVVNGAAAGTFPIPKGAVVTDVYRDTPTTLPGTPTNTNLSLGSAAAGAQYVAAVDVKAQGFAPLTVLYALRKAAAATKATVHYTVASTGGTAADQDGSIDLYVEYVIL